MTPCEKLFKDLKKRNPEINTNLVDKAKKIMRLLDYYSDAEIKKPFISYDFNDKAIVIEWHLEKTSAIHITQNEVFYYILVDDTVKNSLEGVLESKRDFEEFIENSYIRLKAVDNCNALR